jgi:hypothetical protein
LQQLLREQRERELQQLLRERQQLELELEQLPLSFG